MSIFDLFLKSGFLVKIVIFILVCLSISSWAFIIQSSRALISAFREIETFENKFWSGTELSRLYQDSVMRRDLITGSERIFYSGFKEFTRLHCTSSSCTHETIVKNASRAMYISMNRELEMLEIHIPFLGTIGSISPYIGLFGTVWGIMHAFIRLGEIKQATMQMIAPGIAESLITTAISLFTAIPALISFNNLSLKINKLEQQYINFIEEFIAILHRQSSNNDI